MNDLIAQLCLEPALAWKVTVGVLGAGPASTKARRAAAVVREAPLVRSLLAKCTTRLTPYKKWDGQHWVLSLLADLGYPAGEAALVPLMEATYACWLSSVHEKSIRAIDGRVRRCASQEGNALWSALRLGLADDRAEELAGRLMRWQWPDGGWNCDKHPEADSYSFMETLIPLRALALYARTTGDRRAGQSCEHAAEVFLTRRLFRRRHGGQVINPHFVRLHYPCYWHYDILFGLKVMAEAGFLADPRCAEALDLLESRRLPDGGFPAEETYARTTRPSSTGYSPVDWGGVSRKKMSPFVTADALYVLRSAGRGEAASRRGDLRRNE
jgi:hypothetical protein